MAEFGEIMRQLRRRCNTFHSECKVCGMGDFCPDEVCVDMLTDSDIDRLEKSVMEWAKEFPEPVYPTWAEYLMHVYQDVSYARILGETIPADIAQKLGIEPKEG